MPVEWFFPSLSIVFTSLQTKNPFLLIKLIVRLIVDWQASLFIRAFICGVTDDRSCFCSSITSSMMYSSLSPLFQYASLHILLVYIPRRVYLGSFVITTYGQKCPCDAMESQLFLIVFFLCLISWVEAIHFSSSPLSTFIIADRHASMSSSLFEFLLFAFVACRIVVCTSSYPSPIGEFP